MGADMAYLSTYYLPLHGPPRDFSPPSTPPPPLYVALVSLKCIKDICNWFYN